MLVIIIKCGNSLISFFVVVVVVFFCNMLNTTHRTAVHAADV